MSYLKVQIALLFLVLGWVTHVDAAPRDNHSAKAADLVIRNARIYTVDANNPSARAVAVKNGRIVAVGSEKSVSRWIKRGTRVVDLGGRLMLPSFGDAHVHPIFGGMSFSRCSLHQGRSLADYQRIIAGCLAKSPGGGVIYGVGWEDSLFPPNGIPRKEILDQVSKDRPLIFMSVGGHSLWVNSKTLERAGISKVTPDPANGHIDRDPTTHEAIGGFQEAAMDLLKPLIPPPTSTEMEASIVYVAQQFNGLGITSWHDAGIDYSDDGSSEILDAYRDVQKSGRLTSHVVIDLKWKNEKSLEQIPALIRASELAKGYGLSANGVKFYLDGVIPQRTAAMIEPYEGSNERGVPQISTVILQQAVADLDARGFQAHFHAIGDGATREALDAVAAARVKNGVRDTRPMISHLNIVDPQDQVRFGKLGVTAIFQPLWGSQYPYMDLTAEAVGPRRMGTVYPENSILQSSGMIAYGADWPVASANPLQGIEVAISRRTGGDPKAKPLLASEGVTLKEAVKAYTINVAYVNRLDKETGSITPGKSADLVVLDHDIFSIPTQEISKAKVLVTLFRGRVVYGNLDLK